MPEFEVVTDDQCRLWASRKGAGEALVACHGGPGVADYLQPLDSMFADHACVVRWDQRGCGLSSHTGPYTMRRSIADLSHIARAVTASPVVLLGHSWGADLALHCALEQPRRVAGLIYVSGSGTGFSWKEEWRRNVRARLGEQVQRRIAHLTGRERTTEEDRELTILLWSADFADQSRALMLAAQMAERWYPVNYECNAALSAEADQWDESELIQRCQQLTIPALIIDGMCDPRPRTAVDSLFHALPMVHRITFRNTGHVPWLEIPDMFRAVVIDYLTTMLPQAKDGAHFKHATEVGRQSTPSLCW